MASTSGQALEVIVSPEALALRKNDAKSWLRVSGDADDALINMQCAAAVAWLESMGVYLITQTVAQHFRDLRWSESLKLWAGPIHSIAGVSVSHEGGAYEELAASEWRLDPALHELEPREYWDLSWFRTWSYADILRVEYQVGFGAAYDSIPAEPLPCLPSVYRCALRGARWISRGSGEPETSSRALSIRLVRGMSECTKWRPSSRNASLQSVQRLRPAQNFREVVEPSDCGAHARSCLWRLHNGMGARWTQVRAHVEEMRGTLALQADSYLAKSSHKFTIRYRSDVSANTRLLWDGEVYRAIAKPINVQGRRVVLEIYAEHVAAANA